MLKTLAGLFCASMLFACGAPLSSNDDSDIQIKGGYTAASDSYYAKVVVGIATPTYVLRGMTFCSGSFIEENVILTAAHCVTPDESSTHFPVNNFRIVSGVTKPEWTVFNVKTIGWNENYDSNSTVNDDPTAPNDLALIYVEGANPFTVDVAWDKEVKLNDKIALSGFGTIDGRTATGTLRWVYQFVTGLDPVKKRVDIAKRTQNNAQGACGGDSGGPMFVIGPKGKLEQRGVLSIGTVNPRTGECLAWNSYTDLSYYKDWYIQAKDKLMNAVEEGSSVVKL